VNERNRLGYQYLVIHKAAQPPGDLPRADAWRIRVGRLEAALDLPSIALENPLINVGAA